MNHDGFERRMNAAKVILANHNLEANSIQPLEYEEDCPFPYNNFIYRIDLEAPITVDEIKGWPPKPHHNLLHTERKALVSQLVLRISNPQASGLNNTNRVANEVAALSLARSALSSSGTDMASIVPAVYAWKEGQAAAKDEKDFGWVLMEYKDGVQLSSHFEKVSGDGKVAILGQVAQILSKLQNTPLPRGVNLYGGMNINDVGEIISGEMTTLKGGPWTRFTDFWQAKLLAQLSEADDSPILAGWRNNDLRMRIEQLLEPGLAKLLTSVDHDTTKLRLVHGDLTMSNLLINPASYKVTGLVDFDFSFVSHPANEYLTSLQDLGGNTGGPYGTDTTGGKLTESLLTGNFDIVEDESQFDESAREAIEQARAWDTAIRTAGGLQPSKVAGMRTLEQLRRLEGLLCPFRLVHPVFVKRKTSEELARERALAEDALSRHLQDMGY